MLTPFYRGLWSLPVLLVLLLVPLEGRAQGDDAETIVLTPGQTRSDFGYNGIQSPNGKIGLRFDSSEDLVLVKICDSSVIWKQVVTGLGKKITMQENGNFEVRGTKSSEKGDNALNWQSDTAGHPGAILTLKDNGFLCVFSQGRCIWSNNVDRDTACTTYTSQSYMSSSEVRAARTILMSGQELSTMELSLNGSVALRKTQSTNSPYSDSKVEVIRTCDDLSIWSPGGSSSNIFVMQSDGNLVSYGSETDRRNERNAYWSSQTPSQSDAVLKLFDDGLLCVAKDDRCLWTSQKRLYSSDCATTGNSTRNTTKPQEDETNTVLKSGQKLRPAQVVIYSPSGLVGLRVKNGDGKPTLTVFRKCDGDILFSPPLLRRSDDPVELFMQRDGNLVLYGVEDHQIYWSSNTHFRGAVLKLYDNGLMCVFKNGACIWKAESRFPSRSVECCGGDNSSSSSAVLPVDSEIFLQSGDKLNFSQSVSWDNKGPVGFQIKKHLGRQIMTVFRKCDEKVLWSPIVSENGSNHELQLTMRPDGNLVLADIESGEIFWTTNTQGHPGAVLKLFDDGMLCVSSDNACVWSTESRFTTLVCSGNGAGKTGSTKS